MLTIDGHPAHAIGGAGTPDFDQRGIGFARIYRSTIDIGAVESENTPNWHNANNPTNVNDVEGIGPLDALLVVNELNKRRFSQPVTGTLRAVPAPPPFFDVNNDAAVTPLDALLVVNDIPSNSKSPLVSPGARRPAIIADLGITGCHPDEEESALRERPFSTAAVVEAVFAELSS